MLPLMKYLGKSRCFRYPIKFSAFVSSNTTPYIRYTPRHVLILNQFTDSISALFLASRTTFRQQFRAKQTEIGHLMLSDCRQVYILQRRMSVDFFIT